MAGRRSGRCRSGRRPFRSSSWEVPTSWLLAWCETGADRSLEKDFQPPVDVASLKSVQNRIDPSRSSGLFGLDLWILLQSRAKAAGVIKMQRGVGKDKLVDEIRRGERQFQRHISAAGVSDNVNRAGIESLDEGYQVGGVLLHRK